MIIDYRGGEAPRQFEGDVCILGAGIAGLTIARTFIGRSQTVWVIESGGLRSSQRNQALYEGANIGEPGIDPAACRLRTFGGSCNLWGGGCVPLDSTHHRSWVPHSGWPLSRDTLEPYYLRAGALLGLGSLPLGDTGFLAPPPHPPLQFDPSLLRNQLCAASPLLPGDLRGLFGAAPNVHVLLNANVLELEAADSGASVRCARIASLERKEGKVRARRFVLACGGIENARLLLLSDSVVPHGLGNARGLVGRYFMDHPSGRIGTIETATPEALTTPYTRTAAPPGGVTVRPEITLSEAAQQRHGLLSARVRPFPVEAPVPGGLQALRQFRSRLADRHLDAAELLHRNICRRHNGEPCASPGDPGSLAPLALRTLLGAGDLTQAAVRRLSGRTTVPTVRVDLIGYFEQAPNPDSRIVLGEERDETGQRKVCVDWRLTDLDRHTHRTAAIVFGEELARACNGRFFPDPPLLESEGHLQVAGSSHHLGTTRMGTDAAQGVVDVDCRVHGVDNLYCAGSSVFPTGGWAFPTFAIVALATRLADHLQRQSDSAASAGQESKRANELTR